MFKKCLFSSFLLAFTTMVAASYGPYPYVCAGLGITANTATSYGSLSAGGYSAKPCSDVATASLIYKFA